MKELRYLVFFDKIGFFASKQSKETEDWIFTKKIGESKRHKTITGAFIRLDHSKNIEEFKDVNRGILVEQVETKGDKEITKIVAKMDYKVMDKLVKEKEISEPVSEVTTSKVIEPSIEPTVIEEPVTENSIETTEEPIVLKKRRGRPPGIKNKLKEENKVIEGYQATDDLDTTLPPREEPGDVMEAEASLESPEELTNEIKEESHIKVAKISTDDSFWD